MKIEHLINESIGKVNKGNDLMNTTEEVLKKIVENTNKTSQLVREIAGASENMTGEALELEKHANSFKLAKD